MEETQGEGAGT